MEKNLSVLLAIVALALYVKSTRAESGFLITAPQKFVSDATERVCATFFELHVTSIRISIKTSSPYEPVAEVSQRDLDPTSKDLCLDIDVPNTPGEREFYLHAEIIGRSSVDGSHFSETQEKTIIIHNNDNKFETYVQTDKPIYKAGQTVKFRILSLSYPDLKPYTRKIRKVYIQEPGGRRIQQWSNVDTRLGLADMEMSLSPEPPLGNWTIFAKVHGRGKMVQQSFEVGEYVLPKFGVTIKPHKTYISKDMETVDVEICAQYSYGEPVKGSIETNFTLKATQNLYWLPVRPVITESIDDTGSDGCHTFHIDAVSLEIPQVFEETRLTYYKLHVETSFTEQGTDVIMTESGNVATMVPNLYELVIEGPDSFKPGLPYQGMIRLSYPDKFPVSNKVVNLELTNTEGGEQFQETVTVTVNNGVGEFVVTPPRNAENTKINILAVVYQDNSPPINRVKFLQAWFSPSGSFLQVAPMIGAYQARQQANIDVDFTLPILLAPQTITFHYRIISRGNVVLTGHQDWTQGGDAPTLPIEPQPRTVDGKLHPAPFELGTTHINPRAKRRSQPIMPRQRPSNQETEPDLPVYRPATVTRISIPVTMTTKMAPKSKIIVYYIHRDGEVVSGHGQFTVANVFENKVSIDFNTQEAKPGAPIKLTVNAAPQSLCAVGIVDKSVHLLRDSNRITANKVQAPLASFDTYSETMNPSTRCSSSPHQSSRKPRVDDLRGGFGFGSTPCTESTSTFSKHLDTYEAFRNAGMVVLTNLDVETRPCYTRQITKCHYYRPMPFGPMRRGGGKSLGLPGPMAVPDMEMPMFSMDIGPELSETLTAVAEDEENTPLVEIRSYFPETWIWHLDITDDTGSVNISSEVPHTITDWIANGFCTSVQSGFGLANPVKLRAFQPFFLSYNLPYSAIREEKIPVLVTVFNYLTECFTVELSIETSSDFSIVDDSSIKYVCVCDRESKTVNFTIIPRSLGDIKITVHGSYVSPGGNVPFCGNDVFLPSVEGVRDAIEDTLLIEPEGVEREDTFSEMVCVEKGEDFTAVVPLSLPADVIPDSARGTVFVTGDIMGSVLSNLDSILTMPTGCGEQNMIKFAPNIYVLQYLTRTNQLTKEIEDKALEYLRVGYQRELTYRLSDGSYSAFGESDGEGSTWLTAFVLKSFVQANTYIDIDTSDIITTRRWLLSMQDRQSGCFRNSGVLRHKSMKGGVSDEVTLTAYVLIALIEAGVGPSDSRVTLAEECISTRLTESYDDPYSMALVTFALLLADNPDARVALQQLDQLALTDDAGLKYWKRIDDEVIPEDCHYCKPPSASVEMTSYALLAYLLSEDKNIAESMAIVRWMNQQRSALGGYSTTQDTVMGLQSLSEYTAEVYRNDTNMAVDVTKSDQVFIKRFVLNADNKILLQRLDLDETETTLTFDARGIGCALVQAQLRYNIPAVRNIRREPFDITLEMSPPNDIQLCGTKTLNTCVRYVGTRDETSMAVVEIKMVTGYEVNMGTLMMYLQKHGQEIGLKRVEPPKKGTPLVLYFDKFDSRWTCFEVEVKQNVFVDGAKPASIKVYDYYEPGVKSYISYNTCPPKEIDQLEKLLPSRQFLP